MFSQEVGEWPASKFRFPQTQGGLQIGILAATTFSVFANNYMFTFGTALTAPGFVTIGNQPTVLLLVVTDF